MTTFDDDFVRIRIAQGLSIDIPLVKLGLEWPPPLRLGVVPATDDSRGIGVFDADRHPLGSEDIVYQRVSCSQIDDNDRVDMSHGSRRANYVHVISPAVNEVAT